MALDAANFIAELSITDPPGSDPLSQGDDQIRTIKRATFQSFPLVAAAVNLTDAQLNLAAIKNEENIFTAKQTISQQTITLDDVLDNDVLSYLYFTAGVPDWGLSNDNNTVPSESKFRMRRWLAGVGQTDTYQIDQVTNVMDFDQVPTVQGAPLWIAGELRQFVASSTPGANWFVTDGTNGTVDLRERILMTKGATHTTPATQLDPNLIGTAAAGTSGATALTEAQMPAHNHTAWITNNASGGITDININTTDNVFGGRRNDSSKQFSKSNGTRDLIGDAGSGSTHNHSTPATALVPTGVGANVVRPKSTVVETWQYVP